MGGFSRRRIGAVAVTGLVVAGVAAASSMSASGAEPPEATQPLFTDYGTLTINLTDRDGSYELRNADGVQVGDNEIISTTQPCATIDPGSGDRMVLTANPSSPTNNLDVVQVRNSGFGVNTGNTSCGSSAAALISGAEQLKFELGSAFSTDVYIESADLNVTQTKKGDLRYTLEGGQTGGSDWDRTTVFPQSLTAEVADIKQVSDLFRSITIESTSTKDNEGISILDGTTFNLVKLDPNFEVAVDCGEKVTEIGGVGDVATKAVYLRGQNELKVPNQPKCDDVGVVVEVQTESEAGASDGKGGRVYWDNSFVGVGGTQQRVQGTVTIEWAPVFITGMTQAQIDAALDREIDYDGPGAAAGFTDTLWCLSFTDESNFTLPPYSAGGANTNGTAETTDDTAPWCLVSDTRVLTNVDDPSKEGDNPEPAILQIEKLAGKGDPWRL